MAPLALVLLSLAVSARAQMVPGAPSTPESRATDLHAQFEQVMRPQPLTQLLGTYADEQKRRDKAALTGVPGSETPESLPHRDLSDREHARLYNGPRRKTETVELSFLRPLTGLTAGVGWGESRQFLGQDQGPIDRSKFAFVRFQLSKPRRAGPFVFLPEARVTETEHTDRIRQSVDEFSIRDLPRH